MPPANIITIANTTTKIGFNYNNLHMINKLLNQPTDIGKNIKVLLPEALSGRTFPINIAHKFYEEQADCRISRLTRITTEAEFVYFAQKLYIELSEQNLLIKNSPKEGSLLDMDLTIGFEVWSNAVDMRAKDMPRDTQQKMPSTTQPITSSIHPFVHSNSPDSTGYKDINPQICSTAKTQVNLDYDDAFLMNIHYVKSYLLERGVSPENINFDLHFLLHKWTDPDKSNYKPMP
jgi:hypothetical protein